MASFVDLLAEQPILLLCVLLAGGSIIGTVSVRRFSLGPAAVLFLALALSAYDDRLKLPAVLGALGLVLFAYTIGVTAGPSFAASLRTGGRAIVGVVLLLVAAAGATILVGHLAGLSGPVLSGVYAGALTNTPALAASVEQLSSDQPVVGYSVTYLGGVLGMLIAAGFALRVRPRAGDTDPSRPATTLERGTVRIDVDGLPDLDGLAARYDHHVVFSRLMTGDEPGHPGTLDRASATTRPARGDILTVVGDASTVARVVADLGHASTVPLVLDRAEVDFRRVAVSNRRVAGHTVGELALPERFSASATRVRRGDVDLLATDDLVLALGDRVRLVAAPDSLAKAADYLGDSERGASDLNPVGLFLGLGLGVLVGLVRVPLPGGSTVSLGLAGGTLLVGLALGRLQRTGPVLWSLPHSVSSTLGQFGMLCFLATAGSNAGAALATALASDLGPRLLATGAAVTVVTALGLIVGAQFMHTYGETLAGVVAGTQTQPAVLAYANDLSDADPRVNLGYALVYPVAMIVKVLLAPVLGRF